MSTDDPRLVPLEGGYNFRDGGGYQTADGRAVRQGLVFRAAALSGLSGADLALLDRMGIRLVIDLRATAEREHRPSRMMTEIWARDYSSSEADMIRALRDPATTPEACTQLMVRTYRILPEEQADSFAEMFRRVAVGALPLVFHCAVGKDRTGVAAALLLALLDVPRSAIEQDYLETARFTDRMVSDARAAIVQSGGGVITDAVLQPILGVDPRYLDAMFDEVEERYGSVSAYVEQRLGVSADQIASIRERLLN